MTLLVYIIINRERKHIDNDSTTKWSGNHGFISMKNLQDAKRDLEVRSFQAATKSFSRCIIPSTVTACSRFLFQSTVP